MAANPTDSDPRHELALLALALTLLCVALLASLYLHYGFPHS